MSATQSPTEQPLVTIQLLGFPLDTYRRAAEHVDGLMREFTLFAIDPPADAPGREIPQRLRELVDTLTQQYAGIADAANAQRDAAIAAGLDTVDLTYHVPPAVAAAATALGVMLDEADEFCRHGDLLTLATPPDALAFRRWYLSEFVNQISGQPPRPWPGMEQRAR